MKIDAHVHYTPPSLAAELEGYAEQEPYWGLLLSPGKGGKSVQGWASVERMLADMDRAEIDRVVLQGEYPQRHETCVTRNDQAIEIARRWPDRVIAFAAIQPKAGRAALDDLARCVDSGLRGVGELNPYAQGYALDDPDLLRLAEACITGGIPLSLHVSEPVGPYYLGKSSTPLWGYYRLASRYPELKLVLAHWGGGLLFYETNPRVRDVLANVCYDTAASPLLYPTRTIFAVALQCVDPGKILYGSDYPLRLYPRTQAEPDFRPFLEEISHLGLPREVYASLVGRNAARLFGLSGHGAETWDQDGAGMEPSAPAAGRPAIEAWMAVSDVAEAWPETRQVFERYEIPWRDSPVPFWEPIAQAAAARGYGPRERGRLLEALNQAIA